MVAKKKPAGPPTTRGGYNDTQPKAQLAPKVPLGSVTGKGKSGPGGKGNLKGYDGGKRSTAGAKTVEGLNVRGKGPWAGMNSKAQTPRAPRSAGKPRSR